MPVRPPVTVLTFSGHRQPAVTDSADFRTWRGLGERLGSVWCVWAGPHLRSDEDTMHVLRRPRRTGTRSFIWAARAVCSGVRISRAAARRGETVVLNGAEPWGWLSAWFVALLVRRPWLMEVHGDYLALPVASLGRWRKAVLARLVVHFARRADVRRVVAQSMVDSLGQRGITADLVPPRIQPIWQQPLDRDRPPLSGPGLSLLAVGRLVRSKGYDLLLEAVAALVETMPPSAASGRSEAEPAVKRPESSGTIRLRIAGDGPERERLMARAAELGLSGVVEFLGVAGVEGVRRELAAADLFVISSRDEGLPRTLLEAAASGVPVVATAVGGIPAAAAGWASVTLVSVDAMSLAAGVRTVARRPPSSEQLAAVRKDVIASYGFAMNLDTLATLYRRCGAATRPESTVDQVTRDR